MVVEGTGDGRMLMPNRRQLIAINREDLIHQVFALNNACH